MLAAIKTAKHYDLGPDDVIVTVATDGASLYESEQELALAALLRRTASTRSRPAEVFGEHLLGAATDNLLELTRRRPGADLQPRLLHLGRAAGRLARGLRGPPRCRRSGRGIHELAGDWDALIDEFNARTGVLEAL